jgi:hypothetical protein
VSMKRRTNNRWTPEEEAALRQMAAQDKTPLQIGLRLWRSASGIETRAMMLGLKLGRTKRLAPRDRLPSALTCFDPQWRVSKTRMGGRYGDRRFTTLGERVDGPLPSGWTYPVAAGRNNLRTPGLRATSAQAGAFTLSGISSIDPKGIIAALNFAGGMRKR